MDIDPSHAALLEQPGGRLDHDRWPGEVGLAAIELVEVGGHGLVHQPVADVLPSPSLSTGMKCRLSCFFASAAKWSCR